MTISFFKRRKPDGEFEDYSVCSPKAYNEIWLPICRENDLWIIEFVISASNIQDYPEEGRVEVLEGLEKFIDLLRIEEKSSTDPRVARIREGIEKSLEEFSKINPDEYEYGFC